MPWISLPSEGLPSSATSSEDTGIGCLTCAKDRGYSEGREPFTHGPLLSSHQLPAQCSLLMQRK